MNGAGNVVLLLKVTPILVAKMVVVLVYLDRQEAKSAETVQLFGVE